MEVAILVYLFIGFLWAIWLWKTKHIPHQLQYFGINVVIWPITMLAAWVMSQPKDK